MSKDDSAKKVKPDNGLVLDKYPTVRSRQNLLEWLELTERRAMAAGCFVALRCEREIENMNDKELLACGKLQAALVECMAGKAERNEFKSIAGDEYLHAATLLNHMAKAVEPDSIIDEDEARAALDKAVRVRFADNASPGQAKDLCDALMEKSDACKPDDQLDEKRLCDALVMALPFDLHTPWDNYVCLLAKKNRNIHKLHERPARLAHSLDAFFKSREDQRRDTRNRALIPNPTSSSGPAALALTSDSNSDAADAMSTGNVPLLDLTSGNMESALAVSIDGMPAELYAAYAALMELFCEYCRRRGHTKDQCACLIVDMPLDKIRSPQRKAEILKSRATGVPPPLPPPRTRTGGNGTPPATTTQPTVPKPAGPPRVALADGTDSGAVTGMVGVVEFSFGGEVSGADFSGGMLAPVTQKEMQATRAMLRGGSERASNSAFGSAVSAPNRPALDFGQAPPEDEDEHDEDDSDNGAGNAPAVAAPRFGLGATRGISFAQGLSADASAALQRELPLMVKGGFFRNSNAASASELDDGARAAAGAASGPEAAGADGADVGATSEEGASVVAGAGDVPSGDDGDGVPPLTPQSARVEVNDLAISIDDLRASESARAAQVTAALAASREETEKLKVRVTDAVAQAGIRADEAAALGTRVTDAERRLDVEHTVSSDTRRRVVAIEGSEATWRGSVERRADTIEHEINLMVAWRNTALEDHSRLLRQLEEKVAGLEGDLVPTCRAEMLSLVDRINAMDGKLAVAARVDGVMSRGEIERRLDEIGAAIRGVRDSRDELERRLLDVGSKARVARADAERRVGAALAAHECRTAARLEAVDESLDDVSRAVDELSTQADGLQQAELGTMASIGQLERVIGTHDAVLEQVATDSRGMFERLERMEAAITDLTCAGPGMAAGDAHATHTLGALADLLGSVPSAQCNGTSGLSAASLEQLMGAAPVSAPTGDSNALRVQCAELDKQVGALQVQLAAASATVQDATSRHAERVAALEARIAEADTGYARVVSERDAVEAERGAERVALQVERDAAEAQMHADYAELQRRHDQLAVECARLEQVIEEVQRQDRASQLSVALERISALEAVIVSRDAELAEAHASCFRASPGSSTAAPSSGGASSQPNTPVPLGGIAARNKARREAAAASGSAAAATALGSPLGTLPYTVLADEELCSDASDDDGAAMQQHMAANVGGVPTGANAAQASRQPVLDSGCSVPSVSVQFDPDAVDLNFGTASAPLQRMVTSLDECPLEAAERTVYVLRPSRMERLRRVKTAAANTVTAGILGGVAACSRMVGRCAAPAMAILLTMVMCSVGAPHGWRAEGGVGVWMPNATAVGLNAYRSRVGAAMYASSAVASGTELPLVEPSGSRVWVYRDDVEWWSSATRELVQGRGAQDICELLDAALREHDAVPPGVMTAALRRNLRQLARVLGGQAQFNRASALGMRGAFSMLRGGRRWARSEASQVRESSPPWAALHNAPDDAVLRWVTSVRDLLEFCDLASGPDAWRDRVSSDGDLEVEVEVEDGDDAGGEAADDAARERHTANIADHLHPDGSYIGSSAAALWPYLPHPPEYLDGMYSSALAAERTPRYVVREQYNIKTGGIRKRRPRRVYNGAEGPDAEWPTPFRVASGMMLALGVGMASMIAILARRSSSSSSFGSPFSSFFSAAPGPGASGSNVT